MRYEIRNKKRRHHHNSIGNDNGFPKNLGVYALTADIGPWESGAAVSTVTTTMTGPPGAESTESKSLGSDVARGATSFRRQG